MKHNITLVKQRAYFRSLEKRRLECQLRLDKAKFDYVVSKVIGEKKPFVRNYSFLFQRPQAQSMSMPKDNHTIINLKKTKSIFHHHNNDHNSTQEERHSYPQPVEIKFSNDYMRKMFKKKLFAEIYQKKQLPERSSPMELYKQFKIKRRNKTQKDQSTSCEQNVSAKLPLIKTTSNDKISCSNENIIAKNYILSAGISSIRQSDQS